MTTDSLQFSVDEALTHLRKVDPVLEKVIEQVGPFALQPRPDPYASLIRTILYQQLAGAAAYAIQKRWLALYGYGPNEGPPTPEQIVATTEEQFRSAGVSRQKLGYLRDLALHVLEGRLNFAALPAMSDEEVVRTLTAVKGLGEWSGHMFLMFHLGRPDVLPTGDLGMRSGMRIAYGLPETPTPTEAKVIGAKWAPFRSVASWYMWRVTAPVVPDI